MTTPTDLDPFTFEVLRHRLWTVNAEGAMAMQRVSGSPLATEGFDMNTSILSAAGEVVFVGPYLLTGPMGQGMIVRWILREYAEEPGIAPGEMFLCNDPYVGAAHQNCVTVVAPIHIQDELLAWAGATLHVVDVGGPTAGQVGIGARSIFDEAPVIPPLRIVRAGRVQADAEASYLRRSRTPELNALDLRAEIAALNTIAEGVRRAATEFGIDAVRATLATEIDRAEAHMRRRLRQLPDGEARRIAYVDRAHDGMVEQYAVVVDLRKRGESLALDFRSSSPQAPAVVNCTRSGLMSGVLVGLLTTLVWDGPWCPAAIERVIEVRSEPGTVVDAAWPAGCSMATMASGFAATTTTALAVGDLLARDPRFGDHTMAAWAGAVGSVDVFGQDGAGRPFGTVLLDTMASGTGATAAHDGIDTGGFIRSLSCVIANVEHIEAQFPLLYLYRRQEPDTGGPGRLRGGVGVGFALVPHGVDRIATVSPHFSGTLEPESLGLAGGLPGGTNAAFVVRDGSVRHAFRSGRAPAAPGELAGRARRLPGVAEVPLGGDDALVVVATGGGGFGDAIEREPELVAQDVRAGLVSRRAGREMYGVILDRRGRVRAAATVARRDAIRVARLRGQAGGSGLATGGAELVTPELAATGSGTLDSTAPDGWTIAVGSRSAVTVCPRCGGQLGSTGSRDPLAAAVESRRPFQSTALAREVGRSRAPSLARAGVVGFDLVERVCPRCARRLEVDRVPRRDGAPARPASPTATRNRTGGERR